MGLGFIFFGALLGVLGIFILAALGHLARLAFTVAGDIVWHRKKRVPKPQVDDAATAF